MPQFLYFDLGKVLVDFCNTRMVRQVAEATKLSPEQLKQALFPRGDESDPQWLFESGQIDEEEYFDFFCRATGVSPDRAALTRAACDIFSPWPESERLVRRLHQQGQRLGILSNTNPLHWKFLMDGRFPFLTECFAVQATSFAAKSMKPHRAIYDYAAELAGVPHHEIFFTDDRPENVHGALEAGFEAVLFTGVEQLTAELAARGIA